LGRRGKNEVGGLKPRRPKIYGRRGEERFKCDLRNKKPLDEDYLLLAVYSLPRG